MPLTLSPSVLRAAYDLLSVTEPFVKWNLPDSEEIKFQVVKDRVHFGWHNAKRGKNHKIAISRHTVGTVFSLLEIMAHEMIHVHTVYRKIQDTSEHGVAFQKLADHVCRVHPFDRRRFA